MHDVKNYAPINVNPVGGGECGQGVGIWQIFKSVKKAPNLGEKI